MNLIKVESSEHGLPAPLCVSVAKNKYQLVITIYWRVSCVVATVRYTAKIFEFVANTFK